MDFLAPLCVEFHPLYVDLRPLYVDLIPHKTKAIFMGALVGALFVRNPYKTNNKQRINRGYDSESGTKIHINGPPRRSVLHSRPAENGRALPAASLAGARA